MKVTQMVNKRGNAVKNQLILSDGNTTWYQSYDALIARQRDGQTVLDKYMWKYSNTTSKYRAIFLNESTKVTQAKINSGEYILANLND